ncbi:Clavaminate synthase-like protein [Panus rudis PR-1116 ss-1]|nr:Clavaminate synthase-like protein [Panus rudis PR-1116 ss-1]
MARARRRSNRANVDSPDVEGDSVNEPSSQEASQETDAHMNEDKDKCPACPDMLKLEDDVVDKESWVRCDACKTWFHWRCAGKGDLEAIDKWFCRPCLDADPKRVITMKPPARKSSRKKTQRDYAGLNTGQEADPLRWLRMMEGKAIKPHPFKTMKGDDLTLEWINHDESALTEPVIVEQPEGLGMKMPPNDMTIREIAQIIGENMPVEVIDVATQSNVPGWSLGKWAEYYETAPESRDKIRNVISLEISGTPLADNILPPRLVRELDWVEKFWPSTKKGRGHSYPKVQLYCLMGVAGAWTDWHIDFAGSSVYYHILRGAKIFYFIRPTPSNLSAYEKWSGTELQNYSWLGDMVDDVYKVELEAGNTMIIPTGWIHAVYTPKDTLVFGGNFLHSYNVATQLRVREIEIATHVPKKFRFPYFTRLCWYAGEKFLRDLKAREEFSPRVLRSLEALANFLVSEARSMERGNEHARREAKEQVPGDRVKDAPALARELRWRVRQASGYTSDDEGGSKRKGKVLTGETAEVNGHKRKRAGDEEDAVLVNGPFRNWKPRAWDHVVSRPTEHEQKAVKVDKSYQDSFDKWAAAKDVEEDMESGVEATMSRRRDIVVKVRRTARGMERQWVERIGEEWTWATEHPHRAPSIGETSGTGEGGQVDGPPDGGTEAAASG